LRCETCGRGLRHGRHRITCIGARELRLPYTYVGADDHAPNYTGQSFLDVLAYLFGQAAVMGEETSRRLGVAGSLGEHVGVHLDGRARVREDQVVGASQGSEQVIRDRGAVAGFLAGAWRLGGVEVASPATPARNLSPVTTGGIRSHGTSPAERELVSGFVLVSPRSGGWSPSS
jgi:hypothetical protein